MCNELSKRLAANRLGCIHISAPISGTAFDVLAAALSGQRDMVEACISRPISFDYMAPTSAKKYEAVSKTPANAERLRAQKSLLLGLSGNGKADGIRSEVVFEKKMCFKDPEKVKALFEIGSVYTHVLNRSGHAVMKRLTAADIEMHLDKGWYVRCYLESKRFSQRLLPTDIFLVHDDFVIVDKPSGLPSIPTIDNFVENAVYQTGRLMNAQMWCVHRLDQPTSGCFLLAKSSEACSIINKTWRKNFEKYYSLIVQTEEERPLNPPSPGTVITHWTDNSQHVLPRPMVEEIDNEKGLNKECSLVVESWEPLQHDPENGFHKAMVTVKLLTGRTHQIRAQMARLGWPLKGDILYSKHYDPETHEQGKTSVFNPPIHLRCYRMKFSYKDQDFDIKLPAKKSEVSDE